MSEKIYCGNGKEHTFKDGGKVLKLSFSKKDLQVMLANLNEKGYINLQVARRKKESEWGHTHSVSIDTWVPQKKAEEKADDSAKASGYVETKKDDDEFPW